MVSLVGYEEGQDPAHALGVAQVGFGLLERFFTDPPWDSAAWAMFLSFMGVAIPPGQTACTRMPKGESWLSRTTACPCTAPLLVP